MPEPSCVIRVSRLPLLHDLAVRDAPRELTDDDDVLARGRRAPDHVDRRRHAMTLTERTAREVAMLALQVEESLLAGLPQAEKAGLGEMLRGLARDADAGD